MTATMSGQPTLADPGTGTTSAAGGAGKKAKRKRGPGVAVRVWRWCRRFRHFVIPVGIVLALVTVTLVAHTIQTPDVTDRDYLNPTSDAGIGGYQLAQRLTSAGVNIIIADTGGQATTLAIGSAPATIFVPAPDLSLAADFDTLALLPPGTTVVLVAPGGGWLTDTGLPVRPDGGHWATVVDDPGCSLSAAAHAGTAAADRDRYTGPTGSDVCYGGGLVAYDIPNGPEVVVVGASDPFRNDRIAEHGNAALAAGLLAAAPTLIWLDRHTAEQLPRPKLNPTNQPPGTGATYPGGEGGGGRGTGSGSGGGGGGSGGGGAGGDQNQSDSRGGLADTFPPWLWALLGLLLLAGVVIVLAAARRLGPPVGEPLPVTAYGRETLDGRGRLYRRARDPAATYDVLRRAAVAHLRTALHMPAADVDEIVDTVATLTGTDRAEVVEILVDGAPAKDAELTEAVARLDALMSAVHHATPSAEGDRR